MWICYSFTAGEFSQITSVSGLTVGGGVVPKLGC